MLNRLVFTLLIAAGTWRLAANAGERLHVAVAATAEAVTVTVDGKAFTTLHAGRDARKPYLHPMLSASGKRVTRAYPMEQAPGETADLPHQRGVWIGAEHLSGIDFWENEPSYDRPNKGTIRLTGVDGVTSGAGEGRFTLHADWVGPASDTMLVETRTMTVRAAADSRTLDIDLNLTAKRQATFEDNHDAILGLRLAGPFEETRGGHAVNAEGLAGWERLRGARSAWVDWHATVDGEDVGVAVMDAPTNFRFPTPWHVRDYALLFASPFASRDYSKTAPDGSLTLRPGESLRLRYRILVHPARVDVAAAFKEFAQ
jgi:Family of unknown function (DUF6807)